MSLAKRTYSLPPELLERFEQVMEPGARSGCVAKLIGDWLAARERETLRREVIEGCQEMAGLYRDIEQEWHGASEEVWRDTE